MATFHPFPNLPMELQDRIWHFALEQAHGERRVGMRLDQIGSRTTIAWSSLSIFLKDSDSVNRRKPSSIRRGVVSDIIISCRGARHYFTHLRTKQLRLFPGLVPAGTEGVELYNFLSAVNLDFDCFQIHWPMCRPYLSWYDEIGSHDSRQWPPILYHLRQVDIIFFEDHLIDLLVHTTRKRASQTTRLGRCDMFHTVALGPFAHPKAKIESLAVTIKVQLVLSVDKILERLDRVITTFSSYAAMDSSLVANEYRWSSWLSSVWRLAALNSLGRTDKTKTSHLGGRGEAWVDGRDTEFLGTCFPDTILMVRRFCETAYEMDECVSQVTGLGEGWLFGSLHFYCNDILWQ